MIPQQHKPGQPVVGFNHNFNYKTKTFHVQTEDSGTTHGHIITHIFLGGNILASLKSSYADVLPTLGAGEVFATVRKLMEDQHKGMVKALLGGQHDAEIVRRTGGTHYEPGVLAGGERAPGLLVGGEKPAPNATPSVAAPARPPPKPLPKPLPPPPIAQTFSAPATPAPRIPKAEPQTVNLARPVAKPMPSSLVARPPASAAPMSLAPLEAPMFGDGLLTERSLDEVILSYLAADLDAPKR